MRARALGSFLFLALIAFSGYAGAEVKTVVFISEVSPGWLRINEDTVFRVSVRDQVSDGCWTNVGAVKTAVELEIKRSGFKLGDDTDSFLFNISIVSLGYETSEYDCLATYRLEVLVPYADQFISDVHKVIYIDKTVLWMKSGVLSGKKDSINSRLKEKYVDFIQNFLLNIDRYKKKLLDEVVKSSKVPEATKFWSNYKY